MKVEIPERQLLMFETLFSDVLDSEHELSCLCVHARRQVGIKRFSRRNPEAKKEAIEALTAVTGKVVDQALQVVNTLYSRGFTEAGRHLNRLVSLGKRIVTQTKEVLSGSSPEKRIYSLHEPEVTIIKKGKRFPDCEFGSLVALSKNDDGLILSHVEYHQNIADVKTMGQVITCLRADTHRQVGHLKNDHRTGRCRYKGKIGDTTNVVWATIAWNTKKIVHLHRLKEEKVNHR